MVVVVMFQTKRETDPKRGLSLFLCSYHFNDMNFKRSYRKKSTHIEYAIEASTHSIWIVFNAMDPFDVLSLTQIFVIFYAVFPISLSMEHGDVSCLDECIQTFTIQGIGTNACTKAQDQFAVTNMIGCFYDFF